MAPRDQLPLSAAAGHVLRHPDTFDFFQAVRLLEQARPDAQEVGTGSDALAEAVSFRGRVAYGFPTADVVHAAGPDAYRRGRLEVAFLCLAGADGPLPAPYTELVQRRAQRLAEGHGADNDARQFLDIFNHRLVSYFYRARKRRRLALARPGTAPIERILFQLIGFNEGTMLPRLRRLGLYPRLAALRRHAGQSDPLDGRAGGHAVRCLGCAGAWQRTPWPLARD